MEAVLNESFKAFVRESFPERSDSVVKIFQEVINDRATTQKIGLEDLKKQAINDVRAEFVTKDFLKAEIAEVRAELKAEIAEVRAELKAEIAELKAEIVEVRAEIAEVKRELSAQIADVRIELQQSKVDILKWVFGMQVATITIILAGIKFILT